ncbi:MAG: hypothetical protein AAGF23_01860 [Acidobacteriota bacterium]
MWIERETIQDLLDDLAAGPAPAAEAPSAASDSAAPAEEPSSADAPAAAASSPGGLPAGLTWGDFSGLAGAEFDRTGEALIRRLLEAPDVQDAFLADGDGLLLLGDEEAVALPVIAAELTGRWHALRRQLDIGEDPGVVSVRLDSGRRLDAVAIAAGSDAEYLRVMAWTVSTTGA